MDIDLLKKIQEVIPCLRKTYHDMESKLIELLHNIQNDYMVPKSLSQEVGLQLQTIEGLQSSFEELAKKISLPSEISSLPKIEEYLCGLEENEAKSPYREICSFINSLHSKNEKIEGILEECRQVIRDIDIENLKVVELEAKLTHYFLLKEMWDTVDKGERLSKAVALLPPKTDLSPALIMALQDQSLIFLQDTVNNEHIETKIADQENDLSSVNDNETVQDVPAEQAPEVKVPANDAEILPEETTKEEVDPEKILEDKIVSFPEAALLSKEYFENWVVEKNEDAEKKEIGYSIFRNEMSNLVQYVNGANEVVSKVFESLTHEGAFVFEDKQGFGKIKPELCRFVVSKLHKLGYLEKYSQNNVRNFYFISPRCCNAFMKCDIKKRLGVKKLPFEELPEVINPFLGYNYSMVRKFYDDPKFKVQVKPAFRNDYYLIESKCSEPYKGASVIFTGVFSQNFAGNVEEYLSLLKETYSEEKLLVLMAVDFEHVKLLADWLKETLQDKIVPEKLYYVLTGDYQIYRFLDHEKVQFGVFDRIEEKKEAIKEEPQLAGQQDLPKPEKENAENVSEFVNDGEIKKDGQAELNRNGNFGETNETTEINLHDEEKKAVAEETNLGHQEDKLLGENDAAYEKSLFENVTQLDKSDKEVNNFAEEKKDISSTEEQENLVFEELKAEAKEHYDRQYTQMLSSGKIYCAALYLRTLAKRYREYQNLYRQFAYAVDDPSMKCDYGAGNIYDVYYGGETVNDYLTFAGILRSLFHGTDHVDYQFPQLKDTVLANVKLNDSEYSALRDLFYHLYEFKSTYQTGLDSYADYRNLDEKIFAEKINNLMERAQNELLPLVDERQLSDGKNKRSETTNKMILGSNSDFRNLLELLIAGENCTETAALIGEFLQQNFIFNGLEIDLENIDGQKIDNYIDSYWNKTAQVLRDVKKSSKLSGSRRVNLRNKIFKILRLFVDYYVVASKIRFNENDYGLKQYSRYKQLVLTDLEKAGAIFDKSQIYCEENVLLYTFCEISDKLCGKFDINTRNYFFVNFLMTDDVMLDDSYRPVVLNEAEQILPEFSFLSMIEKHAAKQLPVWGSRLDQLIDDSDNLGTYRLLFDYLENTNFYNLKNYEIDLETAVENLQKRSLNHKNDFIGTIELQEMYGQIDDTTVKGKELYEEIAEIFYSYGCESNNFKLFDQITAGIIAKIKADSLPVGENLRAQLAKFEQNNEEKLKEKVVKEAVENVRHRIENQNYSAATDLLNRIEKDDLQEFDDDLRSDDFDAFMGSQYDYYRSQAGTSGEKFMERYRVQNSNKETKHGTELKDAFITGDQNIYEVQVARQLRALDFPVAKVTKLPNYKNFQNFEVKLSKAADGRKVHYKHPMYYFGSIAEEKGFRVIYVSGRYEPKYLIDIFKEVGSDKHTMVFLNNALKKDQRRELARLIRKNTDIKSTFVVIDRVVMAYLVYNYKPTAIRKTLMELISPFSNFQPYLPQISNMPQEMFMGRTEELQKIEDPYGVNIVYGGRQLGKSALLQMAQKEINNNENGDRAVYVVVDKCDYKKSAERISRALYEEKIFSPDQISDDWQEISDNLREILKDEKRHIPYLLLLIDEADAFLASCAEKDVNFLPLTELMRVQDVGNARFKFVLAGLRDVVRFRRSILDGNSIFAKFQHLTVKPFKSKEANLLLKYPLEYLGFRFKDDEETNSLLSSIFSQCNYFPGMLQLFGQKLLEAMANDYAGYQESDTPPYYLTKSHVKKALEDPDLKEQIKEKFIITLRLGDDNYYFLIALMVAYNFRVGKNALGVTPVQIKEIANEFELYKFDKLTLENIYALMEEMCELNILQKSGNDSYRFTNNRFLQWMGSLKEIEDQIQDLMGISDER